MAKKKKEESKEVVETQEAQVSGQGVGIYFDEEKKRYVLCVLDLIPGEDRAVITDKETLRGSGPAARMLAGIKLETLLGKLK